MEGFQCLRREDDGSVAVSLEIDSHVELCCGVVQPFDSGRRTDDWETKRLLDVFCRSAIGIRSLYDADFQLL